MARKRKANVPKTSVSGKQLENNNLEVEKVVSSKQVEIALSPELKHGNLGDYWKKKTRKKNALDVAATKTNINRPPFDVETANLQANGVAKKNEQNITFTNIADDKNSESTHSQITPSPVASAEIHIKTQECNTISDLSTLQSQFHCGGNNWTSLHEKITMHNDATVNMLEHYVKNNLFHRLKFISSPEMVMFSRDSRSLCQHVCSLFQAIGAYQITFWNTNSIFIPRFLNKKQGDVCNALKKQFQSKLIMKASYMTCHSLFASAV